MTLSLYSIYLLFCKISIIAADFTTPSATPFSTPFLQRLIKICGDLRGFPPFPEVLIFRR